MRTQRLSGQDVIPVLSLKSHEDNVVCEKIMIKHAPSPDASGIECIFQ